MTPAMTEWPALTGDEAESLRLIASRLNGGRFELAGAHWRYTLAPATGVAPLPAQVFVLSIEWGGARLRLAAPVGLPALLHASAFPQAQTDVLPEELALAAFEHTWSDLLERLERAAGRKVRLAGAGRGPAPHAEPGEFAFVLALDSEAAGDGLHALVLADAAALGLLAMLARRVPLPKRPPPDPALPLRLRLELSELLLPLSDLNRLAVHDVLLPDRPIDADHPRLRLRPDEHHALLARLEAGALVVEQALKRTYMDTTEAGDDRDDPPGRLEDVQVRVTFDLGERLVTVGELGALQPGQALALDAEPPRLVALRVNGRLVGRGELVRIDDRVGVRVLELAS
jgi:type III secretion protein Q